MNSKSDTIDAELNGILKDYRQVLTQQTGLILSGRHRLDIKIADNVLLDEAKAKLQALLLRERLAELTLLREDYDLSMDYEPIDKRIAELSRLSGEESHE